MKRRLLIAASALCLVGLGAGCVPPPPPPDVALIGDSIGYQMMSDGLGPKLIGLNGVVDVLPGRKAAGEGRDTIARLSNSVRKGGWVVIELGSNDVVDPIGTWPATIAGMLNVVPKDRCVALVGIHREYPPTQYVMWNAYAKRALATRSCHAYVDWDWRVLVSRSLHEPELILQQVNGKPDGVHLTPAGRQVLAEMIFKARATGTDQA